ncbi:MAG: hypothetical protein Q8Q23_05155 [bacterium]|nr:hypothetical protein [bacterium]
MPVAHPTNEEAFEEFEAFQKIKRRESIQEQITELKKIKKRILPKLSTEEISKLTEIIDERIKKLKNSAEYNNC